MKIVRFKLIPAVLACVAISAYAGDASFTGLSLGVGVGASHNKVDYGNFLAGHASSKTDTASDVAFAYGMPVSDRWVAGFGATYDLGKHNYGRVNYTSGGAQTVDARLKQHWSLFIAPGYRVAPDWLAYGKVAYHQAKSEYVDTGTGSGTRSHHGTGVGFGVNHAIGRSLEAGLEIQQVRLSREAANNSTGKPTFTEYMVSIGYRF